MQTACIQLCAEAMARSNVTCYRCMHAHPATRVHSPHVQSWMCYSTKALSATGTLCIVTEFSTRSATESDRDATSFGQVIQWLSGPGMSCMT